ncbi:membrane-associated protein, putative [Bodo saltans]|uniref:Membrane-associated protein, putative n=1 Tax=Bodo saltans TaxID=75058 RepID=A0A0S4IXD3_BODSA|nr:membrane-associated protein, putative [Bodo saltans]|eukprot:CUG07813.1 membrane-associated protein, putative [Bodo saltans]
MPMPTTISPLLAVIIIASSVPRSIMAQTCTCNGTAATPQPTAAPMTPAPVQSLTAPITVDIAILTAGIALLLILFGISFYFTVIWPKRAFLEYRRRFEEIVKADLVNQDLKLLKIDNNSPVYGGAAAPNADKSVRRIPTMKEIEQALTDAARNAETMMLNENLDGSQAALEL